MHQVFGLEDARVSCVLLHYVAKAHIVFEKEDKIVSTRA